MGTDYEQDVETLKKDIENLKAHLSDMLSGVGSLSHERVLEARERLKSAMEGFEGMTLNQIRHANEVIHEQSERALQASRHAVARRPITSMAVSFAAGVMAAFLLERRRP